MEVRTGMRHRVWGVVPWAASFTVHLVLALFPFRSSHGPSVSPSWVELAPLPDGAPEPHASPQPAGDGPNPRAAVKKGGSPADRLTLRDLGIGPTGESGEESGVSGDGTGALFHRSGTLLESMRRTTLLHELRTRLENALVYPLEFQRAGIEGTVRLRLRCYKSGRCPVSRQALRAGSRYLRVLVLRTLRGVFALPLGAHYQRQLPLILEMDFLFRLESGKSLKDMARLREAPAPGARGEFTGRKLVFSRTGQRFTRLNVGGVDLGSLTVPAMAFDIESAYESTKRWVQGKERAHPLEKWRLDPDW